MAPSDYYLDTTGKSSSKLTRTATRRERRKAEREKSKARLEKYDWMDYAPRTIEDEPVKKRMVENTFRCNLQAKGQCGCIDRCKYGRPIIPVAISSGIKDGSDIKIEYVDPVHVAPSPEEPMSGKVCIEDRDHLPF